MQDGIEISAQSKFELLQSSIYPKCYYLPNEYFFMIKFIMKNINQGNRQIILKNLILNIKDKKIINKYQIEDIDIKIERRLNKNNHLDPQQ